MDLTEVVSGFQSMLWQSLLFPVLRVVAVWLLALRKRVGWLVLLVEPVLSMLMTGLSSGFQLSAFLLPFLAVYGWWRWRPRPAGGGVPVHSIQRPDWLAAAVLTVLALGFFGLEVLPMLLMHLVGAGAIAEAFLVTVIPLLLYLGLARGVAEAWWCGILLSVLALTNVGTGRGADPLFYLAGLLFTVLLGVLHVYGLATWRAARTEAAASD